ncbi:MAG: M10 family metallopeptidase [Methylococcales bacterium]|nr:M10 family metallopeptidase [Methylococcales bacterium]MDP3010809.1 M10 family metallopeptidase [Methylococcales bacterium]
MKTLNNNGESVLVTSTDSPFSLLVADIAYDAFLQDANQVNNTQIGVSTASAIAKPVYTVTQIITQLTTSWGYGDSLTRLWGTSYDTPSTPKPVISFGVNTAVPSNFTAFGLPLFGEGNGLTAMTALQVATARLSFRLWDNLIASSLVESDGGAANITLNYSSTTANNGTYSSTLAYSTTPNKDIVADQIWMATTWDSNSDSGMAKGAYGFTTMMHEIGHALGLSHPSTYNGSAIYATDAVFSQDNRQYTIMSYFGGYNAASNEYAQDGTYSDYKYPQTPMVYDIAAVQSLYGADTTTRTGDNVYGYNNNFAANDPEKAIFDFAINATPLLTIWDAGGSNDTLDCSGWNGNQIINLTQGSYSSVRGLNNNVGIAFNTVIENAIGGMGNDRLIGNSADNILNGGAGADIMLGGLGNDTYYVDNAGDVVTENVNAGVDTVYARSSCVLTDNIENLMLTGVAAINGTGNTLNNQLVGNTASNVLNGGAGDDLLDGGVSDVYNLGIVDILNGGAGNDSFLARGFYGTGYYNGGADTDLLDFSQASSYTAARRSAESAGVKVDLAAGIASSYYLKAFNYAWADINGQIAVTGIENVKGTTQGDSLSGDANANVLDGGAGNDTLIGKGNNDTLIGGAGNDTYVIDGLGYILTEAATADIDTVQASINFDLNSLSNIENLTLIGTAITGTGNGLDNVLTGNSMSNTLNGGAGNDTLDGGVSNSYNPTITDTLNGDAGNDTFVARGFYGAGKYNGGADTDTLDFSQSDYYTAVRRSAEGAGVKVDLAAGTASSYYLKTLNYAWADANGQIALANIENIRGTNQGDSLTGDSNANYIDGNAGSDIINGGAGDDLLDGGVSDVYNLGIVDILNGGAGNDSFLARGFYGTGYYNGGADTDLLDFSQSDSYTAARRSAEGAGVKVDLATGIASSYYLKAFNYAWADINGQIAVTGIENVKGTTQGDSLSGDVNANVLDGGAGNDSLYGQNGADTFIGGLGKDSYSLAETIAAIDTVRIATGDSLVGSYDVVQGFTLGTINTANTDRLDLDSTIIAINSVGNGNDVGTGVTMISSHSITNGIISFDNFGGYDAPVAIRSGVQMNNVLSYLQANITGCDTVAFVSEGNTFVFQDAGVIDTLVELIGVTARSLNIAGLVDSLWIM